MSARYEFWVIDLPSGKKLKAETPVEAANRELGELAERGWEVVGYARASILLGGTFVLRKEK